MKPRLFRSLLGILGRRRGALRGDAGDLAEALLSVRGEASGVVLAGQVLAAYRASTASERVEFLKALAGRFGPDPKELEVAIDAYRAKPCARTATALHRAAEPRRQELFRRLNHAPGGTEALVAMREDLLRALPAHEELSAVDVDLVHLFTSWFNRGFLVLRPIDWRTPAHILEKVIRYEAVHEIRGWEDLRRRLAPSDRRCFAFMHPRLPDEPLIFVEVAVTDGVPRAIAPLLAAERQPMALGQARTAVFYSISNCQDGLRGVSLGNFLIKQVVEELKREIPSLKTFVTLSPVPGFVSWLQRERTGGDGGLLSPGERAALRSLERPDWAAQPSQLKSLRPTLESALASYLLLARTDSGKPADPVARFHLGNGARLDRLNWMGDPSEKGLSESAGFMVNYLYDLPRIEWNHEAYASRGKVVATRAVLDMLRRELRPRA